MRSCSRRNTCRLCGSSRLTETFSLTPTPPANAFVPEEKRDQPQETFPLDLFFCEDCSHLQLLDVVNPEILFRDYVYVSGTSPVFVKHFENYSLVLRKLLGNRKDPFAVEMGSNDGTLLRFFRDAGWRIQGVDPARSIAAAAQRDGIPTIPDFFSPSLAEKILDSSGTADLFIANNVFAHIDDLDSIVRGIDILLKPDGVFVFEVSYLLDLFEKTLFDTIYHEHLSYHSLTALVPFFQKHGFEIFDAEKVSSHGGSVRVYVKRIGCPLPSPQRHKRLLELEKAAGLDRNSTFVQFGKKIDRIGSEFSSTLSMFKKSGKTIAGFGAPAKATTLMYHFKIGPETINFIVDDSPLKQGLYSPGLHIPVLPSSEIYTRKPDCLVVLAWNFADPIMKKHQGFLEGGGTFIVPLPQVKTYSGISTRDPGTG